MSGSLKQTDRKLSKEERDRFVMLDAVIRNGLRRPGGDGPALSELTLEQLEEYHEFRVRLALKMNCRPANLDDERVAHLRVDQPPPRTPYAKRSRSQQPCDIYRLFNRKGELLYIGISLSVAERMSQHRNGQTWWGEVTRIDVCHYPTREEALKAEAALIRGLKPKYNVMGR